ncbi:hypothetical protein GD1_46 [Paraglaciecola Antarctic GD virus 1]|nr:hypothetical protein GD1_46 [Paraglaciecola Antarctic GD virus 1]
MKTFSTFMAEASRYKKPKNRFPQSRKTYKSSRLALKAGNAVMAANEDIVEEKGTMAVAMFVKSEKYIVVWVSNNDMSMGPMGMKFEDAGHSVTTKYLIDDATQIGIDDWEVGGDYVLKWIY